MAISLYSPSTGRGLAGAVGVVLLTASLAVAQGTTGPDVANSRVGYIDCAIPASLFRLRFDSAYNIRRPTRAEFIWAKAGPGNPGPPFLEPSVDYQEFTGYLEGAIDERFSLFVDVPFRLVNPTVDANTAGPADLNAGFKYAFLFSPERVATFQFRTYVPNGDADRGLGNHHVSLEPAFLLWQPLTQILNLESEFRTWVPVGGTNFSGTILRYGVGLSCPLFGGTNWDVAPVAEFVGWTVLDGKAALVTPGVTRAAIEDAGGDTIVNAKLGLRWQLFGLGDLYTGYGRPLTGDRWYENTFRIEMRLWF